ncbi:hypothetical protein [Phycisphaera mikurensis]|uniref:BioF2-like acetyltransferase domain-containing protein n=1 Tax=Phycisphaera mikurensis (strain NBRC 102666 / KCTC 22515 / FYK2301M01) TaxID=1142394 RepID=I0IHF4_PHYMF|nr:hypothetical protein [Phycisphaera mikurensis]MBB6440940.1 hypothetical protein [Phycisphaera mikurensis]BAM04692.1 hypothetical protein PSMK_25330 [Phycisphaera mikurensis NBRC 102666]
MGSSSRRRNDPAHTARVAARMEIDRGLIQAWGGVREKEEDGWLMRFSQAYSRRGNAVYPLGEGVHPLEKKVSVVEKLYVSKKLRPIFRMNVYTPPGRFDKLLAENGYARVERTSVNTLDLTAPPRADLEEMLAPQVATGRVEGREELTRGWLDLTTRWRGAEGETTAAARPDLLRCFRHPVRYSLWMQGTQPRAAAVLCTDAGSRTAYVFDLTGDAATVAEAQGGDATRRSAEPGTDRRLLLVHGLAKSAREAGFHRLVVETDMEQTLGEELREHVSFEERYRYWFRAKMFF